MYRGECYTLEAVPRANFEREVRRTPEKPSWGGSQPPVVLGGDTPVDEIYGPACNPAVAGAPTLRRGGPGAWLRGAAGFT